MTDVNEFQGVILAAGKGKRIRPFSNHTPKPLLPVLDRPLLVWQIVAMRELGIREIVIVIGHLGHHVVQELGDGSGLGVKLSYVEQDKVLGIAHAVGQLEPYVQRPFLLFLGDIFFETANLASMLDLYARDGVDGVLAVKIEKSTDAIRRNFTVDLDDKGFVRRVIEKPRHPRTNLKGCGLYLFDTTIFDAVRRTPRTALRDEYELTDSIQIFIDYGYGVLPAPVVQADLNLSGPEDLLALNLHVMRQGEDSRHVAADATLEAGADVDDSVIMHGARIEAGVTMRRCLVLPGETVRAGSYTDSIFVAGNELPCK
ncbi:MAG: sugar phosphate nucleotidyltransferase [Planctomycetota bacterium]